MQSNVRIVGSNYSVFRWRGKAIAYLEAIRDLGVSPIQEPEAIYVLGQARATEFVTPRVMNAGSFTLSIKELWDKPVWQHLSGLASANNIIDVWDLIARDPGTISCSTIIKPPQGSFYRVKTYHNVVVATIDDGDTIELGSMSVSRNIKCLYTHATRSTVAASG